MTSKKGQSLSLAQAMEFSDDGRFICTADYPYGIIYANKSWTRMTDYQQHEIEGKDLCFMQGALTDSVSLKHMMYNVQLTGYGKASVINYTKSGKPFRCEMIIQPILSKDMYGDDVITHLLGTLIETSTFDTKDEQSSCSVTSDGRTEQEESNEWMTTASASDSESGSVSSWNSTSDNGNSSPYRDCGDDSSEDVSSLCNEPEPSAKRPRLESNNLLAFIKSLAPEKKICQ